jgi:DNA-binding MarR family transcriptional regulator
MNDLNKSEEAATTASLLPVLMRNLYSTFDGDPLADLPLMQIRVCHSLLDGPRQMSSLSHELGITLSALTQIADRMERAQLVCRTAEEKDRRVRCLKLAPHGEELMLENQNFRVRCISAAMNQMTSSERKAIITSLETFINASVAANREKSSNGEHQAGTCNWRQQLMISKVLS